MPDPRPGLPVLLFYWTILLWQSGVERCHRALDRLAALRRRPAKKRASPRSSWQTRKGSAL